MRIGIVVTHFSPLSESFIRREVLALCQLGHRVFVYANCLYYEPQAEIPADPNLTIREVHFLNDPHALTRAVSNDGIDHLNGSLMTAAHRATVFTARELRTKFTLRIYGGLDIFTRREPQLYRDAAADDLCVGLVVEDQFMVEWMLNEFGVPLARLTVVPNSLDLDLYRPADSRPARSTQVILSIARFVPKKGLRFLIEAFHELAVRHKNVELWLAGYGPEESELRALARGHDHIKFLGAVAEKETRQLYSDADIFCLPCVRTDSGDADGIPTTILEAMAYELPVVCTSILSLPHYVANERNGLLVPPNDSGALTAALERLLNDRDLRIRLGHAARESVTTLCDIKANAARLEQIFTRVSVEPAGAAAKDSVAVANSSTPLVSICITTFNRADLVCHSIDSVLRQTYPHVELVVIDDGSNDDTRRVLESYGSAIRIAFNDQNRGMAYSKNRALQMTSAKAKYVGILDSDDFLAPRFIEACVAALEQNPDAGLVYTDDILVDASGRELCRQPAVHPWNMDAWLRTCNLRGDTWLARRALVMQTELHDEETEHDHDYDLFFQLLRLTTFEHVPEYLVFIRQHNGRSSGANRLAVARDHAANLTKHGYSAEYAYLRARRNPEWVPAIEEGIRIGMELRQRRLSTNSH